VTVKVEVNVSRGIIIILNPGDVVDFFNDTRKFSPVKVDLLEIFASEANKYDIDFSDVRGQENVKQALEVAAAGGHNIMTL
jgi:magnesium chelatase family protein